MPGLCTWTPSTETIVKNASSGLSSLAAAYHVEGANPANAHRIGLRWPLMARMTLEDSRCHPPCSVTLCKAFDSPYSPSIP